MHKVMDNQLIKQENTALRIEEITSIAKAFAESGMFPDTKQAAQAIVKIQAGQEIGIAPFAAMTGIHIIQGKPTIGAGIIASKVKSSGKYDYKVIAMTDVLCSLDFFQGKDKIGNSSFTIDEAKKAGTKNLDRFPKNMLFARAISNGVKWFCPDVFSGPVYTPEEMNVETTEAEVTSTTIKQPKKKEEKKEEDKNDDFLFLWEGELANVKTKADLWKLYSGNKATVDGDERLKKLFKDKENSLLDKQKAA